MRTPFPSICYQLSASLGDVFPLYVFVVLRCGGEVLAVVVFSKTKKKVGKTTIQIFEKNIILVHQVMESLIVVIYLPVDRSLFVVLHTAYQRACWQTCRHPNTPIKTHARFLSLQIQIASIIATLHFSAFQISLPDTGSSEELQILCGLGLLHPGMRIDVGEKTLPKTCRTFSKTNNTTRIHTRLWL